MKNLRSQSEKEGTARVAQLLQEFRDIFNRLDKDHLDLLDKIYEPTLQFRDPFVRTEGLENYRQYLARLYRGVASVRFEFGEEAVQGRRAFLSWAMVWKHPRIGGGRVQRLAGVSHLEFGKKIHYHRDYFDAGEFLYEKLPIIGSIVRLVKSFV